ncbi:MAG: flagellar export chaperone FliS [Acidobacteria bacterium]|nr:flagellar export chaperone FliS [Acidobacteriota bacterium]
MRAASYHAYTQMSVLGAEPVKLIIALYQGAIEAGSTAIKCIEAGDVLGRSKAISKAVNILTELIVSLDPQKGGELASNLRRLYSYMQQKLLQAHFHASGEAIAEVERLLKSLLEAWYTVDERTSMPYPAAGSVESHAVGS